MERRRFLLGLCGVGGTAVALTPMAAARAAIQTGRCKIVNETNEIIYLKIVGSLPGLESHPPRGGILFPEEVYNDELGEGKRVVIAWDHTGEKVLTMKEVKVSPACNLKVLEGDVVVSCDM